MLIPLQSLLRLVALSTCSITLLGVASAQRIYWKPLDDQGSYRCIYGEVQVLASSPGTNFCGCSWWIQCPARGDVLLQDTDGEKHLLSSTIWDTTAQLLTEPLDQGDKRAEITRFDGGTKTVIPWNTGGPKVFRYFIQRRQDAERKGTQTSLFFFDEGKNQWVYASTVFSPDNGDKCIKGFGGTMVASVDNFGRLNKDAPRAALFRLWVGTNLDNLQSVNAATGEGVYGILNNTFFVGSGGDGLAKDAISGFQKGDTPAVYGKGEMLFIPDRKIPGLYLDPLKKLIASFK